MAAIKAKFPNKGSTKDKNYQLRAERIDEMLAIVGDVSYEDYIIAIKKSKKHGSAVLLKRDIDEIYVNNYNPEWLEAWNANLDIQPVLDFFAVITYVTDYWAKPDEGLTPILREAAIKLKSEPEQKKRCQEMANTFMTNRQMGEAEAYYKILPNLTLKYSSVDTIFVPSDKKALRSKFLIKLDEDDVNFNKGVQVKGGKEGTFLEKPDIIDKYCRRDMTEDPALAELRPTQFAKMYEPYQRKNTEEKKDEDIPKIPTEIQDDDSDMDNESEDEDDYEVANIIITPRPFMRVPLPRFIKIKDPLPGEVALWKKRDFPKAMRIHKKRQDTDPNRYFLSELMLYMAYTDEQELGCDDEERCKELYLQNQENIQYVKRYLLPFSQGVEEARHYVEEAMKETDQAQTIGNMLDPQHEQEILECQEEEDLLHPDFVQVNPDNLESEDNLVQMKKTFRKIQLKTNDEILEEARHLDKFQKQVLHVAIRFAQNLIISKKKNRPSPSGPLLMVHGGAGSGKSTVIHVICQYVHKILRKEGDDPDCPYVVLCAFTGSAASNIHGQTLHTLFCFSFDSGYKPLSDKKRDILRNLYKNLKMLIIDEISLVEADLLYKIDLRLREITQIDLPFGNVAVLALGDIMQIKPVKGRYIMQCPVTGQFWLTFEMDSLWLKFECIILENNHRQGEDGHYANMLNRIRVGAETHADIKELKEKVRKESHPDIKREKDALYVFGTNLKANQMNNKRLKALKGEVTVISAICLHKTIKNFKPRVSPKGTVGTTSFQKELRLKIGAKVMLIYNVDVVDGLTNGARGELIGMVEDDRKNITRLIIRFQNSSNGEERRRRNPEMSNKYPGGTSIEKVNYSFSISKATKSGINTANVIQFPVMLAFACTAHKIQGATIPKPHKLIIYVMDFWSNTAAIAYVMLSRICALSQLYILDEFDETKMFPSQLALRELERLEQISRNKNLSEWEKEETGSLKIYSMNCRSLVKHFPDIKSDDILLKSDIICLQETWLDENRPREDLEIETYELHLNSNGKGKGIAIYFKKDLLKHELDIKHQNIQISKFTSSDLDLIVIYRSQSGNLNLLTQYFDKLMDREKPLLIIGDFNFCFLSDSSNLVTNYLNANSFLQLVEEPTHIEGNLIDQAHLRDIKEITSAHKRFTASTTQIIKGWLLY